MIKVFVALAVFALSVAADTAPRCDSVTTASGTHAPAGPYCSGQLIFEDNFDSLDLGKWENENTLAGGGNWEFQWYTTNRQNSFVTDGFLQLRPTLTSDYIGEAGLTSSTVTIPANECTQPNWWGCERTGTPDNIINPIRSARVHSTHSFAFKYGRVEINAKLPTGDWLWPALWFMPKASVYGGWPTSGEIDLMESRGNTDLPDWQGTQIGAQQFGSTLHFGPSPELNGWATSHYLRNNANGFDNAFHRYQLEWTPTYLRFLVDDSEVGFIPVGDGFWARGGFAASGAANPWNYGTLMAPFDQEFYLIMNLAVGGTNGYFPDGGNKPWTNDSPFAPRDFWNGRGQWLHTWRLEENNSQAASLLVDYVRIWAL